ncbi:MAG: hypothetical protein US54_C0032G0005 [Candidatus Roizmanbacteria bacterium GW2011_GWA2_37_7]|uniref:Uncharacterized protein n=1 Tax=Candidatus Roizmanbacteria bacterium GW2011_GWA2_37_7 TaxID=1618481 RepID=A0A0G0H5W3_9BACT|nr:MAG: hypothetical protein US54_C0032G0005 [Candidatus Roizmanbacteria bacterium GW2011_GWA2_37_7]
MRKLSDKQRSIIEPLLPRQNYTKGGRPRADDKKTGKDRRTFLQHDDRTHLRKTIRGGTNVCMAWV